jgi:uncharacterized protein YuzE
MRKITFDSEANAAYIAFKDIAPGGVAESVPINDDLILDIDVDGVVLGLEILNADRFFHDLARGFGGEIRLPEQIDPETFDPMALFTTYAEFGA